MTYELKLGNGDVARWEGASGENAAERYADAHPGATVSAWREPRVQLLVGIPASC
jgi:hypothetical protein